MLLWLNIACFDKANDSAEFIIEGQDSAVDSDSNPLPGNEPDDEPDNQPDTSTPIEEGPVLFFNKESHVGGTNIWGNVVRYGADFLFSTVQNEAVAIRRFNTELEPIDNYIAVSTNADLPSGVVLSDHHVVVIEETLYFAISGFGDRDLFLFSTDIDGNRLNEYRLQENNATPTNDMHLIKRGNELCLRWGSSGVSKEIQCFDRELNPLTNSYTIDLPDPIPQLGGSLYFEGDILSFTGDGPQRNLIVSHYDHDWNPKSPFITTLLQSENDEWNWFPSGVAFHPQYRLWVVSFTHMASNGSANQDSIVYLAAFTEDFQLIDIKVCSEPGFTRPNLTLIDNTIILGYDNGNLVYLESWTIEVPSD